MEDNSDKNGGRLENAEEETLTDDEEMRSTARMSVLLGAVMACQNEALALELYYIILC